jgi:tRNA threonylcarbamoyladenosine biosynthesis protein TsaB
MSASTLGARPAAKNAACVLAFDTSTELMAVAVAGPRGPLTALSAGGSAASATLLPQVHALMQQAGLHMGDLQAIAFGSGPGAFTGLRTACAVAQGLGLGLGLPLLPIDSLLLLAEDARQQSLAAGFNAHRPLTVGVAMDARMDEIYAGRYRWLPDAGLSGQWQVLDAPALYTLPALNQAWAALKMDALAGSALEVFGPRLTLAKAAQHWPQEQDRAGALLRLALQAHDSGEGVDAALALPLYLRDKVAQTTAERAALRAAKTTRRRDMTEADLDAVMAIEVQAFSHPWSRGHFADSLKAGYLAEMLLDDEATLLGYFVAMPGVDELHLLNITVLPSQQRKGHGRALLAAVQAHGLRLGLSTLWLEVRHSNHRARRLYAKWGFEEVGLRRAYYPAGSRREDAVVMRLALTAATPSLSPNTAAAGAAQSLRGSV